MRRSSSRTSRIRLGLAAALSAVAVTGSVSTAAAHDYYPEWIQEHFGSSCAPQCTLCHTSPFGGQDTVREAPSGLYIDGDKPSHRGYGVFVVNLGYAAVDGWPKKGSAN